MSFRRRWRVRLTAASEADIRDILLWTANRFGDAQARVYADTLSRAAQVLTEGSAVPGAGRRDDIADGVMTLHVARDGRKGRHVLTYRVGVPSDPLVIDVLRVFHDAMDLRRHVGEAKDEEANHE
jgi:toxin ParE1/3/4